MADNIPDKILDAKEGRFPTTLEGIKQFYDEWAPTYEKLTRHGFKNIDGVDISTESLKICKEGGLYRRLICDRIGTNKLDINDDSYDGLILCGALLKGHLNLGCFPELIRIVKPGGPIIFSVSSNSKDTFDKFKDGKFESDLQELVCKGLWVKEANELIPDWIFNRPGHQYVYKVV
ncbi:methyltransferase-like protein 27 isoform X2 [Amphiura filiformis]|uniref:methyltransferase-like protein 27 isoform X2 n=1 Tax=Amphiura filiformis TaxID=82378 RepID=UPI003B2192BA